MKKVSGTIKGPVLALALIYGGAADHLAAQEQSPALEDPQAFINSIPHTPAEISKKAAMHLKYAQSPKEKDFADRLAKAAEVLKQGINQCAQTIALVQRTQGYPSEEAIANRINAEKCPNKWRDLSRMVIKRIAPESLVLTQP